MYQPWLYQSQRTAQQGSYQYSQAPAGNYQYAQQPQGSYTHPQAPPRDYMQQSQQSQQGGYQAPQQSHLPPQGMQQDQGMQYAYSNNTGKRKALFIGINYYGTNNELQGCINDAQAMKKFAMVNYGYREEDIVILTDDYFNHGNARKMPTKANMIQAMQWLVSGAQPNDSLIFHYSGHGATVKDLDGDEDNGLDETICPLDFQSAGMIVDDDMNKIMVQTLPPGCRLTAFFDSCHSGSALDLPYTYSTKGAVKGPNMAKNFGSGALNAVLNYERGDLMGTFSSLSSAASKMMNGNRAQQITIATRSSPADVISLSGCKDEQTSADATQGSTRAGAMSYSFLTVMSQNPNQTYLTLLQNLRGVMAGKFQQKPQLACSHPLDVNLLFTL